jgi:3-isopropylmalate/(R)-2-methylmalate dehydratase small subunit
MEPFTVLSARAAALMQANVDTDTLLPAAWMRSVKLDPGRGLFAGWRYREDGSEDPGFVLNQSCFRDSRILVAGRNFGCGSSRENAVWALLAYGFRCVVAPSFADIFQENCYKNGVLPVALDEKDVTRLAEEVERAQGKMPVTVDLSACRLTAPGGWKVPFEVPSDRRASLLRGLDDIDRTCAHEAAIAAFQSADASRRPWIYGEIGADGR